jgi:hypothetical protein
MRDKKDFYGITSSAHFPISARPNPRLHHQSFPQLYHLRPAFLAAQSPHPTKRLDCYPRQPWTRQLLVWVWQLWKLVFEPEIALMLELVLVLETWMRQAAHNKRRLLECIGTDSTAL